MLRFSVFVSFKNVKYGFDVLVKVDLQRAFDTWKKIP